MVRSVLFVIPKVITRRTFDQRRDSGWIHTLLEEAENERMHLMFVADIFIPIFPL